MQVLKEEVRSNILRVAKKEFLQNGFRKTSMKTIARQANITAPTIYCYFKNKDALFTTLVEPVTSTFESISEKMKSEFEALDPASLLATWNYETAKQQSLAFMGLLETYRDEFTLLFSCASGSSLENYQDYLIDQYTEVSIRILNRMEKLFPGVKPVSRFFVHNLAGMFVNVLREAAIHNVPLEDLETYVDEWSTFRTFGWMGIIGQLVLHEGKVKQMWTFPFSRQIRKQK